MLNNLQFRWTIIVAALIFSLYFIFPSIKFFAFGDQTQEQKAIKLGLDLKGGLNIILELDEYIFMDRLAKKRLSKQSKIEYRILLDEAYNNSRANKTLLYDELLTLADQKGTKLNKFFSNLSKSSNNSDIINEIKNQKIYAMNNILDVMRNRISEHDQYGLGEPSIQQLGSNRLVVELAGISDVSRAKEYIQRTADFELSLVKKQTELFDIISNINLYIINNNVDFPSLDSLLIPDQTSEGFLVKKNNIKLVMASMAKGGGLGLYGDFLFGQFNRYGRSPTHTLLGPTLGQFDDFWHLYSMAFQQGDFKGALNQMLRIVHGNTPFINLFYLRMFLDYFILYNLMELQNPGSTRRMETNMKKNNNQQFHISPSRVIPRGGTLNIGEIISNMGSEINR